MGSSAPPLSPKTGAAFGEALASEVSATVLGTPARSGARRNEEETPRQSPRTPAHAGGRPGSRATSYATTPASMRPHSSFAWTPNAVDRTIPNRDGFGSTIDRWNHSISGVTTGGQTSLYTHTSTVRLFKCARPPPPGSLTRGGVSLGHGRARAPGWLTRG